MDSLTAYRRHLVSRGLRPATVDAYTGWVRRLSQWAHADADTLSADDLECWLADHPHWRPWTHSKAVRSIAYYYAWLQASGRRDDNPAADLHPARSPAPCPDPCPEDTYRAALDQAQGQDYWRLRLAADTGLRRSELARCHSSDVAQLVAGPTLKVEGKGGRRRWVPLPADLAAWLTLQHGYAFAVGPGHMTPEGVGSWYRRHLGLHVHSLRHRYATLAYAAGHDLNAVRQLLGHSSATTTQCYLAAADEDLRAAAAGAWADAA